MLPGFEVDQPVPQDRKAPMPGAEGLAEPMRSRWSPSIFDASLRLERSQITTLLHAAQWAPSWGNAQPWAFVVCERGSPGHQALVPHLSRGNFGWVPRASVVFVSAAQVAAAPGEEREYDAAYSAHDLGQAAAHLTLQAQAMGLYAHQFGGFDHDAVTAVLGVPDHYRVIAGIAVGRRGHPSEVSERDREREHRPRRRRPLEEFAFDSAWGTPWPLRQESGGQP